MPINSYTIPANNGSVGAGLIGGREMSLHDRISSLYHGYDDASFSFKDGYELAKNEAAHLAMEADDLLDRALAALEDCAHPEADELDASMAEDTASMIRKWKERTK